MGSQIYSFIFVMWVLMLGGGGLMVVIIGPFSLGSFGGVDPIIFSGILAVITAFFMGVEI